MSDLTSGGREEHRAVKHTTSAHTLALAASVAMLGVSLGVNVQDLLAAPPAETIQSDQLKITGAQYKEQALQQKSGAQQLKIEGKQSKHDAQQHKHKRGEPFRKPVDPMVPGTR